jgi:hypothetical protein
MKKIIVFLLFGGIIFCIVNCKKEREPEPEYIYPGYDTRNRISVEINGKTETDFKFFATIKSVSDRQYDTIPFPRYYDCPKSMEYVSIGIPKNISKDLHERLDIYRFHPLIGVKQKLNLSPRPLVYPVVSPKNACDYDSTFMMSHGYIIEQDISGEYYKKNEAKQNDLTITSFDRISGKLTGEFNLTFEMIDPRSVNKEFPAKLEYRNGKFTVYLKRY